jgi:hypothetical protein
MFLPPGTSAKNILKTRRKIVLFLFVLFGYFVGADPF